MFKIQRYNFEGYYNLCSFDFDRKIYVIHGDYEHNIINSLYNNKSNPEGIIMLNNNIIDDIDNFIKKKILTIFPANNFINYLSFYENLDIFKKIRNEKPLDLAHLNYLLTILELDESHLNNYKEGLDYLLDMKLALIKSCLIKSEILFVILDPNENKKNDNVILINTLNYLEAKLDKIIIIIDDSRHIESSELFYIKYFQGYISKKL